MIARNTRGLKWCVGIVQLAPETSVSEEIADIFRNYTNWFGIFVTIILPNSITASWGRHSIFTDQSHKSSAAILCWLFLSYRCGNSITMISGDISVCIVPQVFCAFMISLGISIIVENYKKMEIGLKKMINCFYISFVVMIYIAAFVIWGLSSLSKWRWPCALKRS